MKQKISFIVIFVLFSCFILSAQQLDNSSTKTTYRFCEIIIQDGFVHNSYVAVDYGQPLKVLGKLTRKAWISSLIPLWMH